MRSTIAKVALIALVVVVSLGFVAAVPARADGGNPFNPGDGRANPLTGDRLAVYPSANKIDVLGLDSDNQGVFLTSFTQDEFQRFGTSTHTTPLGTVTLTLNQAPQATMGTITINGKSQNTLFINVPASYTLTWTGGPFGANGTLPFVKNFTWGYVFAPSNAQNTATSTLKNNLGTTPGGVAGTNNGGMSGTGGK